MQTKRKIGYVLAALVLTLAMMLVALPTYAAETDTADTQTQQTEVVKPATTGDVDNDTTVIYDEDTAQDEPSILYRAHVQNVGTQAWVSDGDLAGTTGRSLRVEALAARLSSDDANGGVTYRAHVQNVGWQNWVSDGAEAGTEGRSLRVEALQMQLTGQVANDYDIYYAVHVQNFGWLAWAKNGETAGTEGLALRIEGVRIELVKKGEAAPANLGTDSHANLSATMLRAGVVVSYQAYVAGDGWQNMVTNGANAGTTGQSKAVQAYRVNVSGNLAGNTAVSYHAHIQDVGDKQAWVSSTNTGAYSGQIGKRTEAIQMNLSGYAANGMDIYYRVHVQDIGWMGWAMNGQKAGTANGSKRVEAIQIVLRGKGEAAPGSTANHYRYISSYPQAEAVLNRVGHNLRAAYNWSVRLRYWRQYYSPNMGTRWYANIGFTQGRGNCYVMAATFTEMARALGYNAHQVVGYVPRRGGGDAPHSWVEIDERDGTWVYDPNFTNETGGQAFHFKYGRSGTWRYYRYHRTKLR